VSQSEGADGGSEIAHVTLEEWPVSADAQDTSDPVTGTGRQTTGDRAVDEVLQGLDAMTGEPLDVQIEVGERVHAVLQARLADLGQE